MLVVLSDTNAPLRGIKNISEYNYYIFSIFVYILDAIEDGALKGKANLILNFLISRDCEYP